MAPTSEERREVAERLRDYAQLRNCYPFEAFYVRLNIALFGDNGWDRTDGDVFERLADLIDPTCEVESVEPINLQPRAVVRPHVRDILARATSILRQVRREGGGR